MSMDNRAVADNMIIHYNTQIKRSERKQSQPQMPITSSIKTTAAIILKAQSYR